MGSWRLGRLLSVLLVVAFASSCVERVASVDAGAVVVSSRAAEFDAGALIVDVSGDASIDAGARIDGGVPLRELSLSLRVWGVDGGDAMSVYVPARPAEIDPATSLELTISPILVDYRVRLIDGADQVVVSDDGVLNSSDAGTLTYRIVLAQPLNKGRTYTLSIDAEVGSQLVDATGAPRLDVQWPLKVLGEPDPVAPVQKAAKKSRKR